MWIYIYIYVCEEARIIFRETRVTKGATFLRPGENDNEASQKLRRALCGSRVRHVTFARRESISRDIFMLTARHVERSFCYLMKRPKAVGKHSLLLVSAAPTLSVPVEFVKFGLEFVSSSTRVITCDGLSSFEETYTETLIPHCSGSAVSFDAVTYVGTTAKSMSSCINAGRRCIAS